MSKVYTVVLQLLAITIVFHAEAKQEFLYEAGDVVNPSVFSAYASIDNGIIKYSFTHVDCMSMHDKFGSLGTYEAPIKITAGEMESTDFGGTGIVESYDGYGTVCEIEVRATNSGNLYIEHWEYNDEGKRWSVFAHKLERVNSTTPNSNIQAIINDRISTDPVSDNINEGACLALTGKSCTKLEEVVTEKASGSFYFLKPEWRLPQIHPAPEQPSTNNNNISIWNEDPYVVLEKTLDFPKLVDKAQVWCKDEAECPNNVSLLMGLRSDMITAYQCTANYSKEHGWFSTNAHCIPEDLRDPDFQSTKSCEGRIFVKFPKSGEIKEETFECNQIRYISDFVKSRTSPDVAYFTVKDPEKLQLRTPVEFNFSKPQPRLKEQVIIDAINPIENMEGLNGELQRKTCVISDPRNLQFFLPSHYAKVGQKFYINDCDLDVIQGNSGSVVKLLDTGKAIGWADALARFRRRSYDKNLIPETDFSFEAISATTAACFTESVFQGEQAVAGFSHTDSCFLLDDTSYERQLLIFEQNRLKESLNQESEKLKDVITLTDETLRALREHQSDTEIVVAENTRLNTTLGNIIRERDEYVTQLEDSQRVFKLSESQLMTQEWLSNWIVPQVATASKGIIGTRHSFRLNSVEMNLCVNPPAFWTDQFKDARYRDGVTGEAYPIKHTRITIQVPSGTIYSAAPGYSWRQSEDDQRNELVAPYKSIENIDELLKGPYRRDLEMRDIRISISPLGSYGRAHSLNSRVSVYMGLGYSFNDESRWVRIKDCK